MRSRQGGTWGWSRLCQPTAVWLLEGRGCWASPPRGDPARVLGASGQGRAACGALPAQTQPWLGGGVTSAPSTLRPKARQAPKPPDLSCAASRARSHRGSCRSRARRHRGASAQPPASSCPAGLSGCSRTRAPPAPAWSWGESTGQRQPGAGCRLRRESSQGPKSHTPGALLLGSRGWGAKRGAQPCCLAPAKPRGL